MDAAETVHCDVLHRRLEFLQNRRLIIFFQNRRNGGLPGDLAANPPITSPAPRAWTPAHQLRVLRLVDVRTTVNNSHSQLAPPVSFFCQNGLQSSSGRSIACVAVAWPVGKSTFHKGAGTLPRAKVGKCHQEGLAKSFLNHLVCRRVMLTIPLRKRRQCLRAAAV